MFCLCLICNSLKLLQNAIKTVHTRIVYDFHAFVLQTSKSCCVFVTAQVNPNYTSTFVFDNDFPAMLDSSPAPGKSVKSPLINHLLLCVVDKCTGAISQQLRTILTIFYHL